MGEAKLSSTLEPQQKCGREGGSGILVVLIALFRDAEGQALG